MPDHDFAVGSKHKLIPSVIGEIKVVKNKDIPKDTLSYSVPTNIAIRSTMHSGISAFYNPRDMNKVLSLPEFTDSFRIKVLKKRR